MTAPTQTVTSSRLFCARYIDDGYEFIAAGAEEGWQAVAAWGKDGWDLGDWPYVVYLFRDLPDQYERASYCEGDITIETYASAADREHATDASALFYWMAQGADWLDRGDDLRGPYRRNR